MFGSHLLHEKGSVFICKRLSLAMFPFMSVSSKKRGGGAPIFLYWDEMRNKPPPCEIRFFYWDEMWMPLEQFFLQGGVSYVITNRALRDLPNNRACLFTIFFLWMYLSLNYYDEWMPYSLLYLLRKCNQTGYSALACICILGTTPIVHDSAS